jgi:phosphate-selective porin OprO and OprP
MKSRTIVVAALAFALAAPAAAAEGPTLRGRVMTDAWGVSSRTDGVDYPSGTDIRAARIGMSGTASEGLSYMVEADFAGDQVTLKDAYVRWTGWEAWTLTVGNQKPLFSLENLTGLPRTTFMERGLPNVFAFTQAIGATLRTNGERWTAGAGVFGETPGVSLDGDEGVGVAGRVTFSPVADDARLVHVGASGYYKHLGAEAGRNFRVRQRPESRIFSVRLADTGPRDADSTAALGAEFATVHGPLSFQGEYMVNRVDYVAGDATFDGAYVQASWFATGERRAWQPASATFTRVTPARPVGQGGSGAFEFALRFSTLDLTDGPAAGD